MRELLKRLAMYAFHVGFVRPVLRFGIGVRFRRRSLIPDGPCIVVSNHNSHLDAAVLMSLFPLSRLPQVHPVAAADYFGTSFIRRHAAMTLMNGIPIVRKPKAGQDPLAPIAAALEAGESLVMFPEGSRGEAGVVAPFRPGVGRLVHRVPGLLVVPVFLAGPERIWPRGQVVPVPLNIDAIVGKPRTYSTELDPKQIAAAVQQDVLALAPPPPPVPGPPPRPPRRLAVAGVDSDARDEAFRAIAGRLGASGRVLGLGRDFLEADAAGVREISEPIPYAKGRAWFGVLAGLFRTSGRYKGQRFVQLVDQAQTDEALQRAQDATYVVTDGSPVVDLIAWAIAALGDRDSHGVGPRALIQYVTGRRTLPLRHWWRFVVRAPEIWLLNVLRLARPPVPDVLVLTRTPVSEFMRRQRERGVSHGRYETRSFVERLEAAYDEAIEALERRGRVVVVRWDTTDGDREALLDAVERAAAVADVAAEAEETPT